MPYFKYTHESENHLISYFWEVPAERGSEAVPMSGDKGESSHKTKYEKLPHSLKSCLDYCAIIFSMFDYVRMEKDRMVRLIVAEGLIEDKVAKHGSSMEDIVSSFIDELVNLRMLIPGFMSYSLNGHITYLRVPKAYCDLCVVKAEKEDFAARSSHSPVRVYIDLYYVNEIPPDHLKNLSLSVQSLFILFSQHQISQATLDTISGLQSLLVLQIHSWAHDILFNEVGELLNLRFLSLRIPRAIEIPQTLGDLQDLQTLELHNRVPDEVLRIKALRHLQTYNFSKGQIPKEVGRLVNLQTLPMVDARCDSEVGELSSLTQLRRLHVENVREENICKLLETVMTMKNLVSLSMKAENVRFQNTGIEFFPYLELFSPPPLVQELHLNGILMELPIWVASMKNLTMLFLVDSSLIDDSYNILQFLPKLKFLRLESAYNAKIIGKDFCIAGGFPRLETLEISSTDLVEWTEIVVGAFPSLTSLIFDACVNLMFLPEGLQSIFTLRELTLDTHEDLVRRLNGEERFKIDHIPLIKEFRSLF